MRFELVRAAASPYKHAAPASGSSLSLASFPVLNGPTRLRFELVRAAACPYKPAARASGSSLSLASFPVLNGPTRLRFELVRAAASPLQARSASKWIERCGPCFAAAKPPMECGNLLPLSGLQPPANTPVRASRSAIACASVTSPGYPCSVRVPSVFRPWLFIQPPRPQSPHFVASSRLGVLALSGSSASGYKLQQSSRHAPSCRPPRCDQPQPRRVVCTQKGKSPLSVPAATSCRWNRRQRKAAKPPGRKEAAIKEARPAKKPEAFAQPVLTCRLRITTSRRPLAFTSMNRAVRLPSAQ